MYGVAVWDMVDRLSCVVQTSTVVAKSVLGLDDRDEAVEILSVVRTSTVIAKSVLRLVGRNEDVVVSLVV